MGFFGNSVFLTVQPVVTAGAYSANDVVGGLMTFPIGSSFLSGNVLLKRLIIGDADNEKAAMDIWIFNTAPTAILDNASFSTISDAEIRDTCRLHLAISASDYTTAGSNALGEKDINKSIDLSGPNFYVYAVFSGTPTLGAITDYRFTFEVWPD